MDLKTCLRAKLIEIGFHGSAQRISAFREDLVGSGDDVNSSLGVFSSQLAAVAAEYARTAQESGEGPEPIVHVLSIPTVKKYIMTDISGFFGLEDDMCTHEDFANFRQELLSLGYDSLEIETGEDIILVALVPEKIRVIAQITPDQAEELDEYALDGESILNTLRCKKLLLCGQSHPPARRSEIIAKKTKTVLQKADFSEPLFQQMSY